MEFRRLLPDDFDSWFACRLLALRTDPSAFLSTYEDEKDKADLFRERFNNHSDSNTIFAAIKDGKVIATAGVFKDSHRKLAHKATIWGMFVEPGFRGQGIGKKLVEMAVAHARVKMDVAVVYLSVESENKPALALYESLGFKCWGTEPKAMTDGQDFFDEAHMTLEL
jgi:ribosomal protein S18 acetylase RimI-like enzyme